HPPCRAIARRLWAGNGSLHLTSVRAFQRKSVGHRDYRRKPPRNPPPPPERSPPPNRPPPKPPPPKPPWNLSKPPCHPPKPPRREPPPPNPPHELCTLSAQLP